jgi:hypothetical protein
MRNELMSTLAATATTLMVYSAAFAGAPSAADSALSLDPAAPLTAATAAELSRNATRPVIVVMKNRWSGADAAADRAPVMHELNTVGAKRVKEFQTVNSFAATVSEGEVSRLKANPSVDRVVPDVLLRRARVSARPASVVASAAAAAASVPTSLTPNVIPGACGANGAVLLEPEALQATHTHSLDPSARTARSLGITGAGVRVAYIADGVDPNNVNFIRPDGKSAFIDYQDFSGDGPGQLTSGGEAFIDSNAIAGQGIHVYDVNGFGAQADPSACNIRIEGMAPGASLVGLDVFGTYEYTLESNFLEAIEYAVLVDHVDVINESYGGNPYPDETSQDINKLFNDAAVAAGVTVTVSTGDSGTTNTVGSPSTDPAVISAGASTTLRFYAQTNYGAARYFASAGWLNDNISSFSSAGFTQTGATIDLVAPGDLGWASCDASALFADCTNFLGQPSVVEESGGTSMSAPLTAGAAALVIEAYRKSHRGASPTPALVKQILTSTASDLGVPTTEQGAGLLNAYKAVLLAQSVNTSWSGNAATYSAGADQALLISQNQLNAVDAPGTAESWPVTVTNPSPRGQSVHASGRTLGPSENVQSGSVSLIDGTSPQFANYADVQANYAVFNFTVPPGADRLSASIAYPGNPANGLNARVRLTLVDPLGRLAAHSVPQGVGNFGNVDVREPAAGRWTGIIFGDVAAASGTNGVVPWQVSTQRFVPFGAVSPSNFYLAPGESQTLQVTATTPRNPGDAAGSIVLTSSGGGVDRYLGRESNSIPVTLRSLVPLGGGGAFSGVLTGGNGRPPQEGQVNYFQFNVGPGHGSLSANVSLTNDIGDNVGAYLINPDGVAVGFGENSVNGTNSLALTANTLNPVAGTWTLIVDFSGPVVGDEISQPFHGSIHLGGVNVRAPGLPHSQSVKLAAGTPVVVPVTITNSGAAPEAYFVDARLDAEVSLPLAALFPPATSAGYSLPLGSSQSNPNTPEWLVPSETSSLQVAAAATVPIVFDYSPYPGDPDLLGAPTTPDHAAGSYKPAGGTVEPGLWTGNPDQFGPYAGPAATGFVTMTMTATTKSFDPAVTSSTGDFWLGAMQGLGPIESLAPLVIDPGQSAVINVTITPTGASGSVVSGTLYVDDYQGSVPPYGAPFGNEIAGLRYEYTIE